MTTRSMLKFLNGNNNAKENELQTANSHSTKRKKTVNVLSDKRINQNDIKQNKNIPQIAEKTLRTRVDKREISDKKCYVKLKFLDNITLINLLNGSNCLENKNKTFDENPSVILKDINLSAKNVSSKISIKNSTTIYKTVKPSENVQKNDEYDFDTSDSDDLHTKRIPKAKKIKIKNIKKTRPKWKIFNDKNKLIQVNRKMKTITKPAKYKILTNEEINHFCNTIKEINLKTRTGLRENQETLGTKNSAFKNAASSTNDAYTNQEIISNNIQGNSTVNTLNTMNNISFNPTYCSSPCQYPTTEQYLPQKSSTPRNSINFNNSENISNIENVNPKVNTDNRNVLKSILKPLNRSPLKEINLSVSFNESLKSNGPDYEKMILNHFQLPHIQSNNANSHLIAKDNIGLRRRIFLSSSNLSQMVLINKAKNSLKNNSNAPIKNSGGEYIVDNDNTSINKTSEDSNDNNNNNNENNSKNDLSNYGKEDIKLDILKDFDVIDDTEPDDLCNDNENKKPIQNTLKEKLKQLRDKRQINKKIKNKPMIAKPTVLTKTIKQLDIRDVINTEDKNDVPVELFAEVPGDDVEIIHYNIKNRRSYGCRPKRKCVEPIIDSESEEEKVVKKQVKKKKKDHQFDKFISELNKTFEDVEKYQLIIE